VTRRIIVWGRARKNIDPVVLVQLLLEIAAEWDQPRLSAAPVDVLDSAVEDRFAVEPTRLPDGSGEAA
jgi:hypothetical protein